MDELTTSKLEVSLPAWVLPSYVDDLESELTKKSGGVVTCSWRVR